MNFSIIIDNVKNRPLHHVAIYLIFIIFCFLHYIIFYRL